MQRLNLFKLGGYRVPERSGNTRSPEHRASDFDQELSILSECQMSETASTAAEEINTQVSVKLGTYYPDGWRITIPLAFCNLGLDHRSAIILRAHWIVGCAADAEVDQFAEDQSFDIRLHARGRRPALPPVFREEGRSVTQRAGPSRRAPRGNGFSFDARLSRFSPDPKTG